MPWKSNQQAKSKPICNLSHTTLWFHLQKSQAEKITIPPKPWCCWKLNISWEWQQQKLDRHSSVWYELQPTGKQGDWVNQEKEWDLFALGRVTISLVRHWYAVKHFHVCRTRSYCNHTWMTAFSIFLSQIYPCISTPSPYDPLQALLVKYFGTVHPETINY